MAVTGARNGGDTHSQGVGQASLYACVAFVMLRNTIDPYAIRLGAVVAEGAGRQA